jgi:hypothetical protein
MKQKCILRELEPKLTELLIELMASDLERRPFVIAEDVITKRFVQFCRRYKPKTGELLFDVPKLNVILKPCPNAATGAMWAAAAFSGAYELPDSAEIAMWIDGDPIS